MTHSFGSLSASLFVGQGAASSSEGLAVALMLLVAALAVALVVVVVRLRTARRGLNALSVEHQSTIEAHRALLDKERKVSKDLEAKKDEIRDLKQGLGSQKKKGFSHQEELKTLRAENKRLAEEVDRSRKERPAFAERPTAKEAPPAKPVLESRPVEPAVKVEDEAAKKEAPPASVPRPGSSDDAVNERVRHLEGETERLQAALRTERDEREQAKDEIRQLRRRVDGLRRIDLVAKSKMELLEDKVHGMGRRYYEAVSELAALKGEVIPPRPRDLEPPPASVASDHDDGSDEGDHGSEASALAASTPDGVPLEAGRDEAASRRDRNADS